MYLYDSTHANCRYGSNTCNYETGTSAYATFYITWLIRAFYRRKKSFDVGQSDITARECHRTYCHKSPMQYSDKGGRMVSSCSLQRWTWVWAKRNTDISLDWKEITSVISWADSLLFLAPFSEGHIIIRRVLRTKESWLNSWQEQGIFFSSKMPTLVL